MAGLQARLPERLLETRFAPGGPFTARPEAGINHSGVLVGEGHSPLLFCAKPILTGEGKGPARGTLVFGSWFTPARVESVRRTTRLEVSHVSSTDAAAGFATAWQRLAHGADEVVEAAPAQFLATLCRADVRAQRPRMGASSF